MIMRLIDLVALCDMCVLETAPVDTIWPFLVLTKTLPTTLRLPGLLLSMIILHV